MFLWHKLFGVSHTICAHLIKVFIVMALCEVRGENNLSSNLSVCIGFLYTVVWSSLLLQLTKQSRKQSFTFSFISLVNWMLAFCLLRLSCYVLVQGNIFSKILLSFVFESTPHISLSCKLVPVHKNCQLSYQANWELVMLRVFQWRYIRKHLKGHIFGMNCRMKK